MNFRPQIGGRQRKQTVHYFRARSDFLEAGKKRLAGDTVREATSTEVKELRAENRQLKEVVAEIILDNRVLKKSLTGTGEEVDT